MTRIRFFFLFALLGALSACKSRPGPDHAYLSASAGGTGKECSDSFLQKYQRAVNQMKEAETIEDIERAQAYLRTLRETYNGVQCEAQDSQNKRVTIDANEDFRKIFTILQLKMDALKAACPSALARDVQTLLGQIETARTYDDLHSARARSENIRSGYPGLKCILKRADGEMVSLQVDQDMAAFTQMIDEVLNQSTDDPTASLTLNDPSLRKAAAFFDNRGLNLNPAAWGLFQ